MGRWKLLSRTGSPPGLIWLIPLGVAAIYLVVFTAQIPQNIRAIEWIGDYASGFTIAETVAKVGSGGHTVLTFSGQFVPLWFGLLTAGLPLHRELWGIAPTLVFILTGLIVGWSVLQVGTRRAAVIATLIALVASPRALVFLMAGVAHNTVYVSTALLGAYLIWLTRGTGRRRATTLAVPPLAGLALGASLASDVLVGATAIGPLGITAAMAWLRRSPLSRKVAASALTSVLISIPVALLVASIMKSAGFVTLRTPIELATLAQLPEHAKLLFEGQKVLFNGYLESGAPGTLHPELGGACVILMSAAFLALLVFGTRTAIGFMWKGARRDCSETPGELARSLHIIYWVGSAVTVCLAFVLTSEASSGVIHESYCASVVLSVAALLPLLLGSGALARWLILTGTSIFFAAGFAGLTSNYVNMEVGIRAAHYAPEVVRLAAANHVSAGYAGYFEASSLTWRTDNRVTIRPVMECATPAGTGFCPFLLMRAPSWYVPARRHTFLLVDSTEGWLSTTPPGLGRPIASYAFGTVQMLIYPYDIAERLGPLPD